MGKIVLKQGIVEIIQNDAILFGKVANALAVKPVTLPQILKVNSQKLTQIAVLRIICDHLGMVESEILEEECDANVIQEN